MKFILGTKKGMTQVFREDGIVVPVTRVKAGPCVVTQIKKQTKDGVDSVQVGFLEQKRFRINKAQQGHLKDLSMVKVMKEFKNGTDHNLMRGDKFTVKIFEPGDRVEVIGWSKGKGFQGVVKRHGFHGSPASHGHKDQLRMPGSIGATDAARVFKGTRMAGHMGDNQVTVKNLEIIEVHEEENELLIKGAVPGARSGLLIISSKAGEIKIEDDNESKSEPTEEAKEVKTEEGEKQEEIKEEPEVEAEKVKDKEKTKKDAEEKEVKEKEPKIETKEVEK